MPDSSPITLGAFGVALRHHRMAHGLSQKALAERVGRTPGTISRLEHGQNMPRSADDVRQIAMALGIKVTTLAAIYAAEVELRADGHDQAGQIARSAVLPTGLLATLALAWVPLEAVWDLFVG